ncbi:HicB-like antitoxin [Mycobacterium phage LeMond]|uniref:HicB-like antitoxin n=1 Tax=Mycobacterium phage KiSi TaxID=2507856 RepID=A0A410TC78_9CAUD|nr:HicB-like antitoxin [Mycobacterium phage KiSi]AYR01160.1 HicB-like antitoxin [Mycobacterium phage LeMond]AYR01263.1 HicB-like antitoxin [Mycobacterium phage Oscar]AYR01695.1 HicB-like antitoxin [Mycobacterium phage Scarlett]QAU06514.1 HicB-like antitoxin [Mycobacterium phage KiSi]
MDEPTTYTARVSRGERYWVVYVPEIDQTTQARTDDEIEPMARDLIATYLDVPATAVAVTVMHTG